MNQAEAQIEIPKRERIRLQRVEGDRNRVKEQSSLVLWYDSKDVDPARASSSVLSRIANLRYTGVVLYPATAVRLLPLIPGRLQKILSVGTEAEFREFAEATFGPASGWIVASPDVDALRAARERGFETCYRAYVDDGATLHESIAVGSGHEYLMIRFRDPTNIPLELVIASLQATRTVLIKEINAADDIDDAIVTLGVMEVGAEGVLFSPSEHEVADRFVGRLKAVTSPRTPLEVGVVVRSVPIGMGYRTCLDLTTLFSATEGMLVGSTSQGGILACPEVFFLPYMELRPFRVNAGAVHSYVSNAANRTDYMTELRAGSRVMVVGADGQAREASVGRAKTEVRPLRLIEVEFAGGERVNVIMQDDWHVRIFSHDAKPLNITELKPGDRVLGHVAQPGRHVGIKVDEHILES